MDFTCWKNRGDGISGSPTPPERSHRSEGALLCVHPGAGMGPAHQQLMVSRTEAALAPGCCTNFLPTVLWKAAQETEQALGAL